MCLVGWVATLEEVGVGAPAFSFVLLYDFEFYCNKMSYKTKKYYPTYVLIGTLQ